jgi:hypothetical protein
MKLPTMSTHSGPTQPAVVAAGAPGAPTGGATGVVAAAGGAAADPAAGGSAGDDGAWDVPAGDAVGVPGGTVPGIRRSPSGGRRPGNPRTRRSMSTTRIASLRAGALLSSLEKLSLGKRYNQRKPIGTA